MEIRIQEKVITDSTSVILVPEKALEEPGYIQTLTKKNDASAKHEFHAMAQMAYYQYQDGELEIVDIANGVQVTTGSRTESMSEGLLLYRDREGGFHVLVHQGMNKKKLLETVYRFCTRWVRLDI